MGQIPPAESAAAELVVGLESAGITAAARAGALQLLQDQLSLEVGCSTLPWCEAIAEFARTSHAPGQSRIVRTGERMSAPDAAFVNGTFGHSFEYDDAHAASLSHPGSAVVSAALAVGEELDADLEQVLVGLIAGYEVYTRIGTLGSPDLLQRGFHPHAVLSTFGAAATVAKMRGFDFEQTLNALSIAYSHSSGATEYTSTGGSIKRVHAGIGTRNGMISAAMAASGITGPSAFLTGAKGFFRTFAGKEISAEAAARFSPEREFEIANPLFKPYCACAYTHSFVDGARSFADRLDDIDAVKLSIQSSGDVVVGNSNVNAFAPQQIEHLQYSLPFQFALSATGQGNGYAIHKAYLDGQLDLGPNSPQAALAERIEIVVDPTLDGAYAGKMVGRIDVTFADGSSDSVFVEDSLGSAGNPMDESTRDAKFFDLTESVLGEERAKQLLAAIKGAGPGSTARELVSLTLS